MQADTLTRHLQRVAVDHRGDAGHVGKGWGGEQAQGDGERSYYFRTHTATLLLNGVETNVSPLPSCC